MKAIAFILALLALPCLARAEYLGPHERNSSQIVSVLEGPHTDTAYHETVYYLYGFAQGVHALSDVVCLPATSPSQISAVWLKYAKAHPEKWSDSPLELSYKANKEAFPCPAGGSK